MLNTLSFNPSLLKLNIKYLTPMRHLLFLCLLFCSSATSLFAEDLYVLYDPSCFDRYEYSFYGSTSVSTYVTYHLKKTDTDRLILEVGNETSYLENAVPAGTRTCSQLSISDDMVRRINANELKVFIIRRDNDGIKKIPVALSAHMSRTESAFRYFSNDAAFSMNYSMLYGDVNLATDGSPNYVNYLDSEESQGVKTYSVRKKGADANSPYSDLTILPQVGIINEKSGMSLTDPEVSQMQLIEINDRPLASYLSDVRAGRPVTNTARTNSNTPTEYGSGYGKTTTSVHSDNLSTFIDQNGNNISEIVYLDEYGKPMGKVSSTGKVTGKIPTAYDYRADGGTIVSRGRTSTDLNLPISAPGEIVAIGSQYPVGTIVYPASLKDFIVEIENNTPPPPTSYEIPIAYQEERPKGNSGTRIIIRPKTECTEPAEDGYHIVQDGESLYSIARKYSLPLGKLCGWNKISSNEVLKSCTKLIVQGKKVIVASEEDVKNLEGQRVPIPENYDKFAAKSSERKIIPIAVVPKKVQPKKEYPKAEPMVEEYSEPIKKAPKKIQPVEEVKVVVKKEYPKAKPVEEYAAPIKKAPVKVKVEPKVEVKVVEVKKAPAIKKAPMPNAIPTSYDTKGGEEEEVIHIVTEGETVYGIAKKLGYTEEKFREINGLKKGEELKTGQKLVTTNCPCRADGISEKTTTKTITKAVKATRETTIVEEVPASYDESFVVKGKQTKIKTTRTYHIVHEGETLFSIAKKYDTSVEQILEANNLEKDAAISINQKIYLQ
jgi:LysM repeat protein